MKKTLKYLIVATLTLPSFVMATPPSQQMDLNKIKKPSQGVGALEQNPNIKKLLDSKTLEQKFLNGVKKLRLGTNSGGGGDEIGLDFQLRLKVALEGLRNQFPEIFHSLEKKGILETSNQTEVIVVDEELEAPIKGYTQNSVAVNLPEMKIILVSRQRWNNVRDNKIKEGIALHEVLSLMKIESTGNYTISSKYVAMEGREKKELASSLQVNRLQQIRSLDETMSDAEVLKTFFNEAHDPISFDDFEDATRFTSGEPITNMACATASYRTSFPGVSPTSKQTAQPYQHLWVKMLVTTKDTRSELGPLLPNRPPQYRIASVDIKSGKVDKNYFQLGVPEIKKTEYEITQIYRSQDATSSPGVSSYRKNNGLIIEKSYSDVYEQYTYCYSNL